MIETIPAIPCENKALVEKALKREIRRRKSVGGADEAHVYWTWSNPRVESVETPEGKTFTLCEDLLIDLDEVLSALDTDWRVIGKIEKVSDIVALPVVTLFRSHIDPPLNPRFSFFWAESAAGNLWLRCDHCDDPGSDLSWSDHPSGLRARDTAYILQRPDGEYRAVGSACIRDYCGASAETVLSEVNALARLAKKISHPPATWHRVDSTVSTELVLAHFLRLASGVRYGRFAAQQFDRWCDWAWADARAARPVDQLFTDRAQDYIAFARGAVAAPVSTYDTETIHNATVLAQAPTLSQRVLTVLPAIYLAFKDQVEPPRSIADASQTATTLPLGATVIVTQLVPWNPPPRPYRQAYNSGPRTGVKFIELGKPETLYIWWGGGSVPLAVGQQYVLTGGDLDGTQSFHGDIQNKIRSRTCPLGVIGQAMPNPRPNPQPNPRPAPVNPSAPRPRSILDIPLPVEPPDAMAERFSQLELPEGETEPTVPVVPPVLAPLRHYTEEELAGSKPEGQPVDHSSERFSILELD